MTTPEVERLISRLKDKDAGIRRSAAEALGKVGLDAKGAVGALARALKDDHPILEGRWRGHAPNEP